MSVLKAPMIAMTTQTAMMSLVALCARAVLATLAMEWRTVQVRNCLHQSYNITFQIQFQLFHSQILMNVFLVPTCVM